MTIVGFKSGRDTDKLADFSDVSYMVVRGEVLAGDDVSFAIDTAAINNKTSAGEYEITATSSNKNYIIK